MGKFVKNLGLYAVLTLLIVFFISKMWPPFSNIQDLTYTQFINKVEQGKVESVKIDPERRTIEGVSKDNKNFKTVYPDDPNLYKTLNQNKVNVKVVEPFQQPWWVPVLAYGIVPVILFAVLWMFLMQQAQGGGNRVMSFGKSRAKLHSEEKTRITFEDVAGVDEAKQELVEVVEFLREPKKFIEIGAKIPKGVLLFGPPGTGKTLLARAVAGEGGVPFFSISGSDFVEMFVGVGASRVRDLFEQAKKNSPCIVFIDEIDAVGRQRGAGVGGGHDEREQTLNQLLVEMDGFEANSGIIVMAATNRPDVLDPALLRPGRFDREIVVDRPDIIGRQDILKVHAKGKLLSKDVNLEVLARRTPGFTGADLANLLNEAAILAARRAKKKIEMSECEEAIERVIAGPERKSRVMSDREKQIVAHHEAGHALVAKMLPDTDPVHKVSIIPRGRALGYVLQLPVEDKFITGKSELINDITVFMGGRVAEELIFNEASTGAQNDIERATEACRKMVSEYGMSEVLGPLTFGNKQEQVFLGRDISRSRNYSEKVAQLIDSEIRKIVDTAYDRAKTILSENRQKLEYVAKVLLEKEVIEAEELENLLKEVTAK